MTLELRMDEFDLRIIKELSSMKQSKLLSTVDFTENENVFYKPYLQRPEVWDRKIINSVFKCSNYPLW
jgi:hypothetical protein